MAEVLDEARRWYRRAILAAQVAVLVTVALLILFATLAVLLGSSVRALVVIALGVGIPLAMSAVRIGRTVHRAQVEQREKGVEDPLSWWQLLRGRTRVETRRAQLLKQWPVACETLGLLGHQKRAPRLHNLKATPAGDYTARLSSGSGRPVTDIVKQTGRIAQVLGCKEVVIVPASEGSGRIEFRWSERLARPVLPRDMPAAPKGRIALGLNDRGDVATMKVLDPRTGCSKFTPLALTGVTGSGKGGGVHAIIAGLILAEIPVALYVYDSKGGVELQAYGDQLGVQGSNPRFHVAGYTRDDPDALLGAMHAAMEDRLARMADRRVREHIPTVEEPLTLFIADEWFDIPGHLMDKKSAVLPRLMREGRAAAFSVIASYQLAEKEIVGPCRELFEQRIGLRTRNETQTKMIFGNPDVAALCPCHRIPRDHHGVFYLDDGEDTAKARFTLYDDADVELLACGLLPPGAGEGGDRPCSVYTLRSWGYLRGGSVPMPVIRYIGESYDPDARWREHEHEAREKPAKAAWIRDVHRFAQMVEGAALWRTVEVYPSKAAALEAEQRLIEAAVEAGHPIENRKHNRLHVPDRVKALVG